MISSRFEMALPNGRSQDKELPWVGRSNALSAIENIHQVA